jgi:hypothetical protein
MVSQFYSNTSHEIHVGDSLLIDNEPGQVRGVFLPHTQGAKDFACWDDGGLLVELEGMGVTLLPFGSLHEVTLVEG